MLGIFLLLGHQFSLAMFWLLPLTLILAGFALGLGLVLGIINVFVRDLSQLVPIVLQILFWFTPIIYPISIIPQNYHEWLSLNPLYHFTTAYQDIILYGRIPEIDGLIIISISTLLLLLFSLFLFRRSNEEMVDVL